MNERQYVILVVEDDSVLNQLVCQKLEQKYKVLQAYSVKEAIQHVSKSTIDLAILDINLPDGTGRDVVKRMKDLKLFHPFIFLTVNDLEEDYVDGYNLGAIGYITKPFSMKILLCKIEASLQSIENVRKSIDITHQVYVHERLIIDFSEMKAQLNGTNLDFSPVEFKILKLLIENKNMILSKEHILDILWDRKGSFIEEHTLVTHISRIRKKLQLDKQVRIRTIYGMGYMFIET